jgi:thioredoxin reductase (NADPH)
MHSSVTSTDGGRKWGDHSRSVTRPRTEKPLFMMTPAPAVQCRRTHIPTVMSLLKPAALKSRSAADLRSADGLLVVCLCAEWCDTCREFRDAFGRIADADAGGTYVWLDIEDESALIGDLDIENFPTLAVFRRGKPLFYGVSLPQESVVQRTLQALRARDARAVEVPEPVAALPDVLGS